MTIPDYRDLLAIEKAGGTVLVPPDFRPPEGEPALQRAVHWRPASGALDGPGHLRRTRLHQRARALRTTVHAAGLLPYCDSENLDVVIQAYSYRNRPVVFVVNDLRTAREKSAKLETDGLPNRIDILIRDHRDRVRVLNIDTGTAAETVRRDDGWHVIDTLEPAWYRLYAVLGPGEQWPGPGPLPPGPPVDGLEAAWDAGAEAVRLSWRLPFRDWVGCDVARYRIYRGEDGQQPDLLAEIEGRILTGPGGVVTSYLDLQTKAGSRCTYQVATVTPLRRSGPRSEPATCNR